MDRMLNDEEVMEIGRKLKKLREKLGLTQQAFADQLFWDVSSYQKIESGKTLMTLDKAVQLHRNYGVDLNYFAANDRRRKEDPLESWMNENSAEENIKMMIRLMEYAIHLLKLNLKKKEGEDTDSEKQ